MADELRLTGELVAVRKKPDTNYAAPRNQPGGDDLPDIFSGSLIVRGYGQAIVLATGPHSKIGQIGSALQLIEAEVPLSAAGNGTDSPCFRRSMLCPFDYRNPD